MKKLFDQMKKPISLLLFFGLLCPFFAAAQTPQTPEDPELPKKPHPFQPKHEFRFEAGLLPITPYGFWHDDCCDDIGWWYPLGETTYDGPVYTTGALGVAYGYQVLKHLQIGVTLNYVRYSGSRYDVTMGDRPVAKKSLNYIGLMPYVRGTWLNRRHVQLYSALNLGMLYMHEKEYEERFYNDMSVTAHLTLLGVSVGRKVFGFAEYGVGARGFFTVGVGYRFDATNKQR